MLKITQEILEVGKKGQVKRAMKLYNEANSIKKQLEKDLLAYATISSNSSSSLQILNRLVNVETNLPYADINSSCLDTDVSMGMVVSPLSISLFSLLLLLL